MIFCGERFFAARIQQRMAGSRPTRMAGRKKDRQGKKEEARRTERVDRGWSRMGRGSPERCSRPKSGLGMDLPGWELGETVGSNGKRKPQQIKRMPSVSMQEVQNKVEGRAGCSRH